MTDDDVHDRLTRIFREQLRQPTLQIAPEMTQDDLVGWDSTAMAAIIMSIEEEFEFEMSAGELRGARSIGDLTTIVARHWS